MEKSLFSVREMCFCAIFAALLAVCSWIAIPITVPVTLQTFAVFAAIELLGTKCSTAAICVWLLLGAAGVPVFAGFKSGLGTLSGVTGGYIIGFLLCPVTAALVKKLAGKYSESLPVKAAALFAALLVCYTFGTAWFVVVYTRNVGAMTVFGALQKCVLPFILFDIIKIALAMLLENRAGRFVSLQSKNA